jgi:hypothetical protein
LPALERFLVDADIDPDVPPYLKAIGFRIVLVVEHPEIDVRDDTALLRYARRHQMILLCHDKHDANSTPPSWYPELARNGGRVIEIGGGPQQPALRAVGNMRKSGGNSSRKRMALC